MGKKITLFIALLAIAFFPAFSKAVTVGPAKIEFTADPGETLRGELFLLNEGSETKVFSPVFEKFIEVNGEKKFMPGAPTLLTNWFRMPSEITLGPGESRQIPFTIELPENADPGGHFAVIWWSARSPGVSEGAGIVTRAGILVYLRVRGDIIEAGDVPEFSTTRSFYTRLPVPFRWVFHNSGNVHLKPSGIIAIKNIFGGTVAELPLNPNGLQVLPDSKKEFGETEWKEGTFGGFAFGLYTAEMNLVFGESGKTVEKSIRFFVFPWKTVLLFLFGLAVLLFGLIKGVKAYNAWVVRKYTSKQ